MPHLEPPYPGVDVDRANRLAVLQKCHLSVAGRAVDGAVDHQFLAQTNDRPIRFGGQPDVGRRLARTVDRDAKTRVALLQVVADRRQVAIVAVAAVGQQHQAIGSGGKSESGSFQHAASGVGRKSVRRSTAVR